MPDPRAVLTRPAPPPDVTVSYGGLPEQVADLRLPAAGPVDAGPRPLVVVVHGGFWRAEYDRLHTGPLAADLASRGFPVAQLEYRRTGQPGGGWPGTFDDVAAGLGAVPRLAAEVARDRGVPVDPGPPVLVGHSAGGHLVLWYAATAAARVRGVLALAPVADLAEAYRLDLDTGAVAALLGGGPADVPDRYAAADPVRRPSSIPTVIVHGDRDRHVPPEISRRYVRAARADGGAVRLVELSGVEHFGLIDPQSAAWPAVTEALRSLAG